MPLASTSHDCPTRGPAAHDHRQEAGLTGDTRADACSDRDDAYASGSQAVYRN